MKKWQRMEKISDIIFIVGAEQFKLHKIVLAAASDVFETMFYGEMSEHNNATIQIDDIEIEDFIEVLNSIYGHDVNMTFQNKFNILYAAEKYMLNSLKKKCENFIVDVLSMVTLFDIFEQSQPFNSKTIDNSCLEIITNNPLQYFEDEKFMQVSGEVLKKIICQPKMNCTSEDLKVVTLRWLKKGGHHVPENGKFNDDTYKILEKYYKIKILDFENKEFLSVLKAYVLPENIKKFRSSSYEIPLLNCSIQGFGLCLGVQNEVEENTLSTTQSSCFETIRIRLVKTYGLQLSECEKTITQTTQGMYILNVMIKEVEIRNEHIVLDIVFGSEKNRVCLDNFNRVVAHLFYKTKDQQKVKYIRL